ncbi:hypothetical protein BSLG_008653 [Batrachochytrium salamandrivorans]|nr:hypothetical protein BSLG_008653 [Batrachochytrium salamandrivorans]
MQSQTHHLILHESDDSIGTDASCSVGQHSVLTRTVPPSTLAPLPTSVSNDPSVLSCEPTDHNPPPSDDACVASVSLPPSASIAKPLDSAEIKRRINELRERRLSRTSASSSRDHHSTIKSVSSHNHPSHSDSRAAPSGSNKDSNDNEPMNMLSLPESSVVTPHHWIKPKSISASIVPPSLAQLARLSAEADIDMADIDMATVKPSVSSLKKQDSYSTLPANRISTAKMVLSNSNSAPSHSAPTPSLHRVNPLTHPTGIGERLDYDDSDDDHCHLKEKSVSSADMETPDQMSILRATAVESSNSRLAPALHLQGHIRSNSHDGLNQSSLSLDDPFSEELIHSGISNLETGLKTPLVAAMGDDEDKIHQVGLSETKRAVDLHGDQDSSYSDYDMDGFEDSESPEEGERVHTVKIESPHVGVLDHDATEMKAPTIHPIVDQIEYESDSFEDMSLHLNTTVEDKEIFFSALRQNAGDRSLNYGELLKESMQEEDSDGDHLDTDLSLHTADWLKAVLEPKRDDTACSDHALAPSMHDAPLAGNAPISPNSLSAHVDTSVLAPIRPIDNATPHALSGISLSNTNGEYTADLPIGESSSSHILPSADVRLLQDSPGVTIAPVPDETMVQSIEEEKELNQTLASHEMNSPDIHSTHPTPTMIKPLSVDVLKGTPLQLQKSPDANPVDTPYDHQSVESGPTHNASRSPLPVATLRNSVDEDPKRPQTDGSETMETRDSLLAHTGPMSTHSLDINPQMNHVDTHPTVAEMIISPSQINEPPLGMALLSHVESRPNSSLLTDVPVMTDAKNGVVVSPSIPMTHDLDSVKSFKEKRPTDVKGHHHRLSQKPILTNVTTKTRRSSLGKPETCSTETVVQASSKIPTPRREVDAVLPVSVKNPTKTLPSKGSRSGASGRTRVVSDSSSQADLSRARKQALSRANARFAGKTIRNGTPVLSSRDTTIVTAGQRPWSSPDTLIYNKTTRSPSALMNPPSILGGKEIHDVALSEGSDKGLTSSLESVILQPPYKSNIDTVQRSHSVDSQAAQRVRDASVLADEGSTGAILTASKVTVTSTPAPTFSYPSVSYDHSAQLPDQHLPSVLDIPAPDSALLVRQIHPLSTPDLEPTAGTIHTLRERISQLESKLAISVNEAEHLDKQVRDLEQKLEDERFDHLFQVSRGRVDSSSSAVLHLKRDSSISRKDADVLRKELDEQETLIRGYQSENEKLTTQVKALRKELKESDQRHDLRQEHLQRENAMLKAQIGSLGGGGGSSSSFNGREWVDFGMVAATLGNRGHHATSSVPGTADMPALLDQQQNPSQNNNADSVVRSSLGAQLSDPTHFSSVKAQVRIETLETELASLLHSSHAKEADACARIIHLESRLTEATATLSTLSGADPDKLKTLEAEFHARCGVYEEYIVELESKLEIHMEHSDAAENSQRQIDMHKVIVKDLRGEMERLEGIIVALTLDPTAGRHGAAGRKTGGQSSKAIKDIGKQIQADTRRIRALERQVDELRQEKLALEASKHASTVSDMIRVPRPTIEESDYVRHLKQRVKQLQKDHNSAVAEHDRKTLMIRDEVTRLQGQYETRIQELEMRLREEQLTLSRRIQTTHTKVEVDAAFERIQTLEEALAAATAQRPTRHHERVGGSGVSTIPPGEGGVGSDLFVSSERELVLSRRILDLQSLVDEQSKRIDQLFKIVEQQQDFHKRIFAVDEHERMDEIHAMRLELESTRSELAGARNKLEISEETRRAVHESTISIMKQSQEESAKIALGQHERGLMLLRQELLRENALSFKGGDSSQTETIRTLHRKLASLEAELVSLRQTASNEGASRVSHDLEKQQRIIEAKDAEYKKVSEKMIQLRAMVSQLQKENHQLTDSIESAKKGWPPAMHHFEALSSRIRELEESAKRREADIARLLKQHREDLESKVQMEQHKYYDMIRHKDAEIQRFRNELDKVLHAIKLLRHQGI